MSGKSEYQRLQGLQDLASKHKQCELAITVRETLTVGGALSYIDHIYAADRLLQTQYGWHSTSASKPCMRLSNFFQALFHNIS